MHVITEAEISQYVCRTIAEFLEDPNLENTIIRDRSIQEMGINSIDLMKLLVYIETHFEIAFEDDELLLENFSTVNVIVSNIMQKLGAPL